VTFLEAVNRVLRTTAIIKGDDDNILTFADIQHNATLNLAIIAIQAELDDLVADNLIPLERDSGSITTNAVDVDFLLDTTFVRFWQTPIFYESVANRFIYQTDEDALKQTDPLYRVTRSTPFWWYFTGGPLDVTGARKVSFYPCCSAALTLTYDFEKNVSVINASDVLPFQSDQEARVFCHMAARHFLILFEEQPDKTLVQDAIYLKHKSTLISLMAGNNPARYYGTTYV
jgi:hypothetical protein